MTAFGGALTDPTKIMGSRIGAYAIDLVLGVAVIVAVFFLFGGSHFEKIDAGTPEAAQRICDDVNRNLTRDPDGGVQIDGDDQMCIAFGSTARVATGDDFRQLQFEIYGSAIVFGLFNYVVLSAIAGGTIGKLVFGLRVVTARGQRAGFGRNLVRWLFLIIDTACCWLPGLLTASHTKGHRRIGDLVAGTFVVHRSAEGRLLHIPGLLHVQNRHEYGAFGPAPAAPAAAPGSDAPVWDQARNTYVRYDPASGVWFQWDDANQSWVPTQQ